MFSKYEGIADITLAIGLSVQEKNFKLYVQDGRHGGLFGFPVKPISAIFNLQVTSMLHIKLQANRLFCSGEEV